MVWEGSWDVKEERVGKGDEHMQGFMVCLRPSHGGDMNITEKPGLLS